MRANYLMAVALTAAVAVTPASAQEAHEHAGESIGAKPTPGMMAVCHAMMSDGAGMDGESMMGMMSGGMMPGGMGTMMPGSEPGVHTILNSADELGLDALQLERLEALRQRSHELHEAHMTASADARSHAVEVLAGDDPDLDDYEQGLWEAAQHMVTVHLGMVRIAFEARSVLTEDQLARLASVGHGMDSGPTPAADHASHHSGR